MSIELYHANGIAKNVQNKTLEEKKKEREEQEKMQEDVPAKGNVWNGRPQAIRGFRLRITVPFCILLYSRNRFYQNLLLSIHLLFLGS